MQRRDASAKFLWVDEHTTSVLGWTWEELREMTALDLVHPDDLERAVDSWMVMGETEPVRLRYRDPSDTYRWFEVHNTYHLEDPDQAFVETEMIDIDAEMRALARVRETEMQYAILMEALPVGVVQVDMGGEIVFANEWLRDIASEITDGVASLEWIVEQDRPRFRELVNDTIRCRVAHECDIGVIRHPGQVLVCRVRLRPMPSNDGERGAIGLIEDVTAARDVQEQLQTQAHTDQLTGLPNRHGLQSWLLERGGGAAQGGMTQGGMTVFFIDLDEFKVVNNGMGHAVGDELLVAVSRVVKDLVRPDDYVARLGGDEFLVACPGVTEPDTAADIARRIVEAIGSPVVIGGDVVLSSCSIGIATVNTAVADPDRLIGDADLAMYEAKRSGGGGHAFFDEEQRRGVESRVRIEHDLRAALRENQFELYLQPIVELATGDQVGVEALIR